MTRISPDVWFNLKVTNLKDDLMNVRLGLPDITTGLFCAIDSDGNRHLLIGINPSEEGINDQRSRGFSVETKILLIHENPPTRYIDIKCLDPAGHSILDIIGSEIALELSRTQRTSSDIVQSVLSKWRRFWGNIPKDLLSREEILGLYAELMFLSIWLAPTIGVSSAIRQWCGPFKSRHDFERPGLSVEAKACTSSRGRIHRIHGLNQLEPPENGTLLLYSLQLHQESGASNTLPSLIETCRTLMTSDDEALAMFEMALIEAGYSPIHNSEYETFRFRVIDEALFIVNEGFPRIIPSSINGGIPPGIESVEYEINLNGFNHLIVARSSSEAIHIL